MLAAENVPQEKAHSFYNINRLQEVKIFLVKFLTIFLLNFPAMTYGRENHTANIAAIAISTSLSFSANENLKSITDANNLNSELFSDKFKDLFYAMNSKTSSPQSVVTNTAPQNNALDLSNSYSTLNLDYNMMESDFIFPFKNKSYFRKRRASNNENRAQFLRDEILVHLFSQLEVIRPCNRTIETPLLQRLLNESTKNLKYNTFKFIQLSTLPTHLAQLNAFVKNSELTNNPIAIPPDGSTPAFVLKLLCRPNPRWTPVIVFPTQSPNSFLQVSVMDNPRLNACALSSCPSKCSYTVHNHLRIYARSCCPESELSPSISQYKNQYCLEDLRQFKRVFYGISIMAAFISIMIIPLIIRERIRQHEGRGWSLMEPFFLGAALLYVIPLLDWYGAEQNTCCIAVWLRIIGFTLFYGSILLKIFRNLQEYRVRKAHHVVVREHDLLKYLIVGLLVSFLALMVWTVSSSNNIELWENSWPQCPMDNTAQMWAACELITLLYAMRLCYKTRSSSWVERYQFTLAICLEAIVTLTVNLIRYSLRNAGSNDALFIVSIIHLHFTVSINIIAIIAPKFLLSSDSTRRSLAMGSVTGSGGRAHPSLAKLRDNLLNGTIDFADIPITEMNTDDIRAELKRVYTQLRMYKLKNIYQENPHISKRKGGGKKIIEKTASKNRRISIPPPTASNSPKAQRLAEEPIMSGSNGGIVAADDEKSDLTVESAPHNLYLSTSNKVRFLDVTKESMSGSVRV